MTTTSYLQNARQRARSNGKYAEMNKCEGCGKALGEGYCSDPRSNGGPGHVVCATCSYKGQQMSYEAASVQYRTRGFKRAAR